MEEPGKDAVKETGESGSDRGPQQQHAKDQRWTQTHDSSMRAESAVLITAVPPGL